MKLCMMKDICGIEFNKKMAFFFDKYKIALPFRQMQQSNRCVAA